MSSSITKCFEEHSRSALAKWYNTQNYNRINISFDDTVMLDNHFSNHFAYKCTVLADTEETSVCIEYLYNILTDEISETVLFLKHKYKL